MSRYLYAAFTLLALIGGLAGGFAWAVRAPAAARWAGGARLREARDMAAACLVAFSGSILCHVLQRTARPLRVHAPGMEMIAVALLMAASVFIFAALAVWLARVAGSHRTLKAGVGSGITLFCGELMHLWLSRRGVGPFIQFDYDGAGAHFVGSAAVFSLACVGLAILLAELAQHRVERRPTEPAVLPTQVGVSLHPGTGSS